MVLDNDKAKKGFAGLIDLASEIGDIDESIKPQKKVEAKSTVHKPPPQKQRKAASSESEQKTARTSPSIDNRAYPKSSNGRVEKWILGIAGVIFLIWLISSGEQNSQSTSYNQPSSSQSYGGSQSKPTPAAKTTNATQSADLQYKKPTVGTNNLLSVPYIRWCIRESIRIDAMRNVIDINEGIEKFNRIVDDYNSRCGSYRYRQGDQSRAERDVEPYRSQIVTDAILKGKQLGRSYQPSYSPVAPSESTSRTPTNASAHQHTREAQKLLSDLGYDPGPADGLYGPKTAAALRDFQRDSGVTVDGQIDQDLLSLLGIAKSEYKDLNDIPIKQPVKANKEYHGAETTISISKMPLRSAMNIFSQVSGREIIVDDGIEAFVSIHVKRPEPWDKILFELMEKYHLEAIFSGNTIRINQIDGSR